VYGTDRWKTNRWPLARALLVCIVCSLWTYAICFFFRKCGMKRMADALPLTPRLAFDITPEDPDYSHSDSHKSKRTQQNWTLKYLVYIQRFYCSLMFSICPMCGWTVHTTIHYTLSWYILYRPTNTLVEFMQAWLIVFCQWHTVYSISLTTVTVQWFITLVIIHALWQSIFTPMSIWDIWLTGERSAR